MGMEHIRQCECLRFYKMKMINCLLAYNLSSVLLSCVPKKVWCVNGVWPESPNELEQKRTGQLYLC